LYGIIVTDEARDKPITNGGYMKYIVHQLIDNAFLPAVSFNTFNEANDYKENYIKLDCLANNFTPSQEIDYRNNLAPLIEESKTGMFYRQF